MELSPKLSDEDKYHLKEGQKKMTILFYEFDRICRKYDIKYWCIGGTFIGAIRHKGWIPYDGDVDVAMLEDDYSKFERHSHELPDHIFLQTMLTDKRYPLQYIHKLRDLYSYYIDYTPKNCHHGLQLDIFIYENKNGSLIMKQHPSSDEWADYDAIFPLEEEYFEGFKVYIPRKFKELSQRLFGNYPPDLFPICKRLPHEGRMISDRANDDDLLMYKELYESRKK